MALRLRNRLVQSIFQLLGEGENDITFGLGWILEQSPQFCILLLCEALGACIPTSSWEIRLQEHGKRDKGYTDIEIIGDDLHVIVEAKRGWTLPSHAQLVKYAPRIRKCVEYYALVVMSACTEDYVNTFGCPEKISGIPVVCIDWKKVYALAAAAEKKSSRSASLYLNQFSIYLEQIMQLQDHDSNSVYVVSLDVADRWPWSSLRPPEYVENKRRYFHPYGVRGWPTTPPNYLGFRYHGQLQSVHYVEKCELVSDLSEHFKEIDSDLFRKTNSAKEPHLLYTLGPPIKPSQEVRTGTKIVMSNRIYVAIDLLLTSKTISDAHAKTKLRQKISAVK